MLREPWDSVVRTLVGSIGGWALSDTILLVCSWHDQRARSRIDVAPTELHVILRRGSYKDFAPTELSFAPTELSFAPTELSFAPMELSFAPTELSFAPTELSFVPMELSFDLGAESRPRSRFRPLRCVSIG
jgi:hypothetical protein